MKRSFQEVVELVVFGLIALLIGVGVLWLVGWILGLVGLLMKFLAGLIWWLLRYIVPIAIVAGLIYFLVRVLQGDRSAQASPATPAPAGTAPAPTAPATGAQAGGSAPGGAGGSATATSAAAEAVEEASGEGPGAGMRETAEHDAGAAEDDTAPRPAGEPGSASSEGTSDEGDEPPDEAGTEDDRKHN